MPFTLSVLGANDMRETAALRLDAFDGVPAQLALRPQGSTPATVEWYAAKHLHELLNDPDTYFVGVSDTETGEIAAYGQWQRDLAVDRAKAAEKPDERDESEKYSPGSNPKAQSEFWGLLSESERRFMGDADYWHLHLLATKPAYRKMGLATMILRWGQERAREDGLPVYLDATAAGRPAYDKAGFVPGPEWSIDLNPYGVRHLNPQWPMRWTASETGPNQG